MTKPPIDVESGEAFLLAAFHGSNAGISLRHAETRRLRVNPGLERMLGYSQEELEKIRFSTLTHPEDREYATSLVEDLRRGARESVRNTKRLLHKSGKIVWVTSEGWLCRSAEGKPLYYLFVNHDISDAKLGEEKVSAQAALLSTILDSMAQGLTVFDSAGQLVQYNQNYCDLFGLPELFLKRHPTYEEITRVRLRLEGYSEKEIEGVVVERLAHLGAVSKGELAPKRSGERVNPNGLAYIFNRQAMPDGGFLDTFTNISELKRLERETAEKSAILQATLENMLQGLAVFGLNGELRAFNRVFEQMAETPAFKARIGGHASDIFHQFIARGCFGPGDPAKIAADLLENLSDNLPFSAEMQMPGGKLLLCNCALLPDGGRIYTFTDITERRKAEEKLYQAQKMEVVSQISGGVAHDFNNLLAVMLGNVEMVLDQVQNRPEIATMLKAVVRAGESGATLTQQLLAFSRQSVLAPTLIDIGDHIRGMSDLISRSLGDLIEVKIHVDEARHFSRVDPGQLSSAILNLALNARDAMPGGGILRIEVLLAADGYPLDLVPGHYVLVRVKDNGTGMTPDAEKHAVEPFFTTKDVGAGSGLGLSMVDGFMRQSGGSLVIDSEFGNGTTISLYFQLAPLGEGSAGEFPAAKKSDTLAAGDNGEKILVVEDNEEMRELVVMLLRNLGYVVYDVANGNAAMAFFRESGKPDLLLSDIVLTGGMSGLQVAENARQIFPDLQVLFMSGYPDQATNRGDLPGAFLAKPFGRKDLADTVRKLLDAERQSSLKD